MNIKIRKQLAVLELGDLAALIENQEKDVIIQQIKHCFIRQIKTGPAECLTMV